MNFAVTTAQTSFAAFEQIFLSHRIEGYNFRYIYQKDFVLSFWVKSNLAGQRSVCLSNESTRSYVATYTIDQPDTWQKNCY